MKRICVDGNAVGAFGVGADIRKIVDGWATFSTNIGTAGGAATTREGVAQSIWFPAQTSREKGTRNLMDAASQSECRTDARFLLQIQVSGAIAAVKRVDCHK